MNALVTQESEHSEWAAFVSEIFLELCERKLAGFVPRPVGDVVVAPSLPVELLGGLHKIACASYRKYLTDAHPNGALHCFADMYLKAMQPEQKQIRKNSYEFLRILKHLQESLPIIRNNYEKYKEFI